MEADRTETDTHDSWSPPTPTRCGAVSAASPSRSGRVGTATSSRRRAPLRCGGPVHPDAGLCERCQVPLRLRRSVRAERRAYYAYSTNAGAGDIQVIRSPDLVNWELVGNGWPTCPAGRLPMPRGPRPCWRGATGTSPTTRCATRRPSGSASACGGFRLSRRSVHRRLGGTPGLPGRRRRIDRSEPVRRRRRPGRTCSGSPRGVAATPPTIWSQELSADGLAPTGAAAALLVADRAFERGRGRGAHPRPRGGGYYLLYAAADWNSRAYAVAYAGCARTLRALPGPADGAGAGVRAPAGGTRWGPRCSTRRQRARVAFHAFCGARRRLPEQPLPPHRLAAGRGRSDRHRRRHLGRGWLSPSVPVRAEAMGSGQVRPRSWVPQSDLSPRARVGGTCCLRSSLVGSDCTNSASTRVLP